MTASVHANPTARGAAWHPKRARMVLEEVDGVLVVSPPAPITPGSVSSMTAPVASVSDLLGDRRSPVVIDLSDRSVTELAVLSGALNLNRLERLAEQVVVVSPVAGDRPVTAMSGAPIPVFRQVADAVQAAIHRQASHG